MRFLIVTHVLHKKRDKDLYAYGPYVREMNLWFKYAGDVTVVAPLTETAPDFIDIPYRHKKIDFIRVRAISFNSFSAGIVSFFHLPGIFWRLIKAMRRADHIHLRCPGNMGLIGCMAQIFYPGKIKTAKYAGNWDFGTRQPLSYRLQQLLLKNTFITRNMTALVYGEWPGGTKNMKSFFTASYKESDRKDLPLKAFHGKLKLVFVGTLSPGKQPLLSAKVCQALNRLGIHSELDFYGEGSERGRLEQFIEVNDLQNHIFLHGNKPAEIISKAFQQSHFLVFISRSEGWPKAVAEAMWWGCLPITSNVSCIPEMVGYGERGELVEHSVTDVCRAIKMHIDDPGLYRLKTKCAMEWARKYTLELFETEIEKLLTQ